MKSFPIRKEMDKVYRRYFKDPIQFWSDVLSERRGQITADELPKMHYDPIELE